MELILYVSTAATEQRRGSKFEEWHWRPRSRGRRISGRFGVGADVNLRIFGGATQLNGLIEGGTGESVNGQTSRRMLKSSLTFIHRARDIETWAVEDGARNSIRR